MRIDSHQHFWKYDPLLYPWITEGMKRIKKDFMPEDLKPVLERNGFEGSIAVQAVQAEGETENLLDLASKNAFIKGVIGWVNPNGGELRNSLERFCQNNFFKGIRHTEWDSHGEFLLTDNFIKFVEILQDLRLPLDLLVFDYQLPSAIALTRQFPEQTFVLNHCGNPDLSKGIDSTWQKNIRAIATSEKVFCKISGLATALQKGGQAISLQPYLEVLAEAFGPGRLIFGSDWPVCLTAASYLEVVKIVRSYENIFTEGEMELIWGENATSVYSLREKTLDPE